MFCRPVIRWPSTVTLKIFRRLQATNTLLERRMFARPRSKYVRHYPLIRDPYFV